MLVKRLQGYTFFVNIMKMSALIKGILEQGIIGNRLGFPLNFDDYIFTTDRDILPLETTVTSYRSPIKRRSSDLLQDAVIWLRHAS